MEEVKTLLPEPSRSRMEAKLLVTLGLMRIFTSLVATPEEFATSGAKLP